jgi:hypothetical protein
MTRRLIKHWIRVITEFLLKSCMMQKFPRMFKFTDVNKCYQPWISKAIFVFLQNKVQRELKS